MANVETRIEEEREKEEAEPVKVIAGVAVDSGTLN
jgi:hypothetical protein